MIILLNKKELLLRILGLLDFHGFLDFLEVLDFFELHGFQWILLPIFAFNKIIMLLFH